MQQRRVSQKHNWYLKLDQHCLSQLQRSRWDAHIALCLLHVDDKGPGQCLGQGMLQHGFVCPCCVQAHTVTWTAYVYVTLQYSYDTCALTVCETFGNAKQQASTTIQSNNS